MRNTARTDQKYSANLIGPKRIRIISVLLLRSIFMNNFIEWVNSFFMPLFFMCSGWCYGGSNTVQKREKNFLFHIMYGGRASYRNYFSCLYK